MTSIEIRHEDDGKRGAHFVVGEGGERLAEMTYVRAGTKRIIVDHTHVDESRRGEGVGDRLLEATAEMARREGLLIVATCPFASARLARDRERYADVLPS